MMNDPVLTEEAFDRFLNWLHPEREQAAWKYEAARRRLIIFFACRGCTIAEDLADKTINRVIRQTPVLTSSYDGDPAHYFYGVAHYIHLEYLREQKRIDSQPVSETWADPTRPEESAQKESIARCLEHCLQKLPPPKREAFIAYYQVNKQTKVEDRHLLAELLDCSINALRLQMLRLRTELRDCITNCQMRGDKS